MSVKLRSVIPNFSEININSQLNENATQQTNLQKGESFSIEDFLYNNSVIVDEMFRHLQSSHFLGLSVSIIMCCVFCVCVCVRVRARVCVCVGGYVTPLNFHLTLFCREIQSSLMRMARERLM